MIELNEMHNEIKEETSVFYKITRAVLVLLGGIIMFYFLVGIVNYVMSGPRATLWDDITTEFLVQVILMGLGLFCLIIAWFRHTAYGIAALVFTAAYVVYTSVNAGQLVLGFLPIAMAVDGMGFVFLGIVKKLRKNKEYNVYADPIADHLEGPDIFNFKI